jgi:hypothetical protein
MPDLKDAQIVTPKMQTPALQEIPEATDPFVILANKLDSVFDANSDMRGILVDIRKDTREITRLIKQAPAIKRTAPTPTLITKTNRGERAAEKTTIKENTRTERVARKQTEKTQKTEPARLIKTASKEKGEAKAVEGVSKEKPTQENKSKPAKTQPIKAEPTKAKQPGEKRSTPTKSQKSLETRKNAQEREKDRKSILSGIKDAVVRVGGVGIDAGKDALKNKDLADIAGTAIGGPLWGVLQEVKEVKDNTDFGRLKSAKDRLTGRKNEPRKKLPKGAKRDKAGRLRDNKGQYIQTGKTPKQNAKTRVIERKNSQNIEDQKRITAKLSELGIQTVDTLYDESREEEKRHEELIDAVKEISTGGKLGMARTGLDMFRSARDRRRGRRTSKATKAGMPYRKRSRTPELVERKRPKQAFGKIRVPKQGPARIPRGMRSRGKFGKIAGLLTSGLGFAGGGGLLSGLFGGGDTSSIPQMATDHVLSSTASKVLPNSGKAAGAASKLLPGSTKGAAKPMVTKTATKLGGKAAMKMGGKLAGGALRAVPVIGQIAGLGMAGIDAYQGWNDREMQGRAFGLKEGQKATTGQKAASSLANVVDMGGLGTGLLSMFGVDADTADIAKSIHGVGSTIGSFFGFGGDNDETAKETKEEKTKTVIKTATPIEKPNTVAVQKAVDPPVSKIEHPQPLQKVERIGKHTQVETAQGHRRGPGGQVDNISLNRLIAALERTTKNASYPFASPSQQPTAPKTNIKADFEDSMLTLMAYDRI